MNDSSEQSSGESEMHPESVEDSRKANDLNEEVHETKSNDEVVADNSNSRQTETIEKKIQDVTEKVEQSGMKSEPLDCYPGATTLIQKERKSNNTAFKLDQAEGGLASEDEDIDQLSESTSSLTVEG